MKYFKMLVIIALSIGFLFCQTYNSSTDMFGNTTTRGSDGSTMNSSTDMFGNTRSTVTKPKESSYWWE